MDSASIKQVNISQIDIDDRSYVFSFEAPLSQLILSIKKVGMLHPPILEWTSEHRYRIVSGLRRILAALHLKMNEVRAEVYETHHSQPCLELFLISFYENLGTRKLNEIEKALVIWKLINLFHVSNDEVISHYLPLMDLGSSQIVLQRYLRLVQLEDYLRSAIVEDLISSETAIAMLNLSPQERLVIFNLFQDTKAGKNNQKELLQLMQQLSVIKNQSIDQLLEFLTINPILTNTRLTAAQKLDKVKQVLKEARYPKFTELANRFQQLKKELKLPSNIILRAPAFFEGSEYSIEIRFNNQKEFNESAKIIAKLADESKLIGLEKII